MMSGISGIKWLSPFQGSLVSFALIVIGRCPMLMLKPFQGTDFYQPETNYTGQRFGQDRMARELVSQGLFRMDEINFWCIGVADSDPPHVKGDQRLAPLLCLQRTLRT